MNHQARCQASGLIDIRYKICYNIIEVLYIMLKLIIYYVDLFIALQAYNEALDLALTATINGFHDEELTDQILYLKGLLLWTNANAKRKQKRLSR